MAEIVIRRLKALWQDRARAYQIIVDGMHAGTIGNDAEARIAVTPGRHTVRLEIDWCGSPEVEVDVGAGTECRLECGPNANPFMAFVYITFRKDRYLWLRDGGTQASSM
jgi:hypothetical protein